MLTKKILYFSSNPFKHHGAESHTSFHSNAAEVCQWTIFISHLLNSWKMYTFAHKSVLLLKEILESILSELGHPHSKKGLCVCFFSISFPLAWFVLFCLINQECWKLYVLFPHHEQCLKYLLCIKYFSRQSKSFQHYPLLWIGLRENNVLGMLVKENMSTIPRQHEFLAVRWSLLGATISADLCDAP